MDIIFKRKSDIPVNLGNWQVKMIYINMQCIQVHFVGKLYCVCKIGYKGLRQKAKLKAPIDLSINYYCI